MSEKRSDIIVNPKYNGIRLDKFLSEIFPAYSRTFLQNLIKCGKVLIDGKLVSVKKAVVVKGSVLSVEFPEPDKNTEFPKSENIDLDIVFEDEYLLAVNKPAGMVVHPGDGREEDTLVNALLYRYADFAEKFDDKMRPGIVHRLDKDTTGLILVAKSQNSLEALLKMFKEHNLCKEYCALVHGVFRNRSGVIDKPIGRHPVNRKKMHVVPDGKSAVSRYKVLSSGLLNNIEISLVKVEIDTGRTHQIRVHFADMHHPLLGDKTYGGQRADLNISRQMLHAWRLNFKHPVTGLQVDLQAEIPDDMRDVIALSGCEII